MSQGTHLVPGAASDGPVALPPELAGIFAADKGAGMEDRVATDFTIPFLNIAQAISPQATRGQPEYIPGLGAGDFFDSIDHRIVRGDVGIRLVCCDFRVKYLEWKPFRGGLVRISETLAEAKEHQSTEVFVGNVDGARRELRTEIVDTAQITCLMEWPTGWLPGVLAWSKTKMKASRDWNGLISKQVTSAWGVPGPQGTMPVASVVYRLTTTTKKNAKGIFAVPAVAVDGLATQAIYEQAKHFRDVLRSGVVTVDLRKSEAAPQGGEADEPIPGEDEVV